MLGPMAPSNINPSVSLSVPTHRFAINNESLVIKSPPANGTGGVVLVTVIGLDKSKHPSRSETLSPIATPVNPVA